MSIVLVTGGSGTLGQHLVPILAERGHEVRVLSRRPGAGTHVGDLATGEGVATAADGAELVVHAASDPRMGRSDPAQTASLLSAVGAAGSCRHLVYLSIVGVDAIPFRYYRTKLDCERLIEASPVPSTTLRATQFHELLARALRALGRGPVSLLPLDLVFQTVAAAEVAARTADVLEDEPLRRAPDFGGPEVLTGWQLAGAWRAVHGRPRRVLSIKLPGRGYRAFADGLATCPEHADGQQTWAQFAAQFAA
ncbi:MAG: SDR family oxidoreductase, partial [Streptosporangiaceae bacterium]